MSGLGDGDREFSSSIVRRTCEKIYGIKIDPHAWLRWKSWAGVRKGLKVYSFEQFCFMAAIAQARRKNRYAELDARQIKSIAYSDEVIGMIGALIRHIDDEGWALGWDIRSALAVRGVEVSGAELKKAIPSMAPNCWYQVDAVMAKLADSAGIPTHRSQHP